MKTVATLLLLRAKECSSILVQLASYGAVRLSVIKTQTKVWDVQQKKCNAVLRGYMGSVKSVCCHPTNSSTDDPLHFGI